MTIRPLIAAVAVVLLAGCSAPASPSPSPTADSGVESPPVTTPEASVPTAAPAVLHVVRGEAGGSLVVDGREISRLDASSSDALLAGLGTPDETREQAQCFGEDAANVRYRWGSLVVTVFREQPSYEYAENFPVGAVVGWTYDPVAHPQTDAVEFSGPEGIVVGAPLASLRAAFETGAWEWAGVDDDSTDRTYSIFAGDTTGALFFLTPEDTVKSMLAGANC